jgi:hypothetical protein
MIIFNIDRICRHFGWCMAIANMPGRFHQARRILCANFYKLLRRRLHKNEAPIIQFQRIAIIEDCGLLKIEQKFRALLAMKLDATTMTPFMIKRNAIDQLFSLNSGLADNMGGTEHGGTSFNTPHI